MKIVNYDIDKIIFAEYNPRELTKDQHKQLTDSINRFGLVDPLIINTHKDRANILVGGHQRLKIAKELGFKDVPCVEVDLTLDKEKELNVRLNKNTGQWDWDSLANYFDAGELLEWGFTEDELQFSEPEEVQGLTDDDDVPEVEESITKQGDLWILGEHRLLCGDATKKEDVERLMDGQKADMVFTDPPYGINEKGDRSKRGGLAKGNNFKSFKDDTIQYAVDAINIIKDYDIKNQVWWGANYYCHFLPQTNNWFVWDKRVDDKQKDTQSDCELAYVVSKWSSVRIFRHLWKGMMKDSEKGLARVHPTQKPIALAEWCFNYFDNIKSVIDLFLGSGSTLIACEKTNRKCYGMEIDPHYCDVIVKRWEDYTGKQADRIRGKLKNA